MIKSLLLLAPMTFLTACPLLDMHVDVPEVCVTYKDIHVDALPAIGDQTIEQTFTVDDLAQAKALADQAGADVKFVRASLHATSGISSFDFVRTASVTIASGDETSSLPAVDVYACTDCSQLASGADLDIDTSTDLDPKPYLATGSLLVTVDLAGQAPTVPWTMDVEICMSGSVDYTLDTNGSSGN